MNGIELNGISKWFGDVPALADIDLSVKQGEFMVLLGPSGCGKTTMLRCIAGVEEPSSGEIYLGGTCVYSRRDAIDMPPKSRNTGIVFQSYALYPHMTVFQNVAFGLKVRKVNKQRIRTRVQRALEMVNLEGFENRYPRQLSGGQQQRVAVARTVVANPAFILFDEPLANLDPMLRVNLRTQLRQVHRQVGTTSVYVTHDQSEAMILADRIAVMQKGQIEQIGTPYTVYHFPATSTVADFTGNPKTNLIPGEIHTTENRVLLVPDDDPYCFMRLDESCREFAGRSVLLHVRPEDVEIRPTITEDEGTMKVLAVMPEGAYTFAHLHFGTGHTQIIVRGEGDFYSDLSPGQDVRLRFRRGNIYDKASGVLAGSFGYTAAEKQVVTV